MWEQCKSLIAALGTLLGVATEPSRLHSESRCVKSALRRPNPPAAPDSDLRKLL
jgi:hypothetical protein